MKNKINLPFTDSSIKGGKSFKILTEENLINKKNGIFNVIKKLISTNKSNNSNKINYIKGSNTKDYYSKISK